MGGRAAVCINENAGTSPINLRPSPLHQELINKVSFYSNLSVYGKKRSSNVSNWKENRAKTPYELVLARLKKTKGNFV